MIADRHILSPCLKGSGVQSGTEKVTAGGVESPFVVPGNHVARIGNAGNRDRRNERLNLSNVFVADYVTTAGGNQTRGSSDEAEIGVNIVAVKTSEAFSDRALIAAM